MGKTCSKCNAQNRDAAKRCMACGAALTDTPARLCPAGHVMDPFWTECPYCGLPEPAAKDPRQAPGRPSPPNPVGRRKTVPEVLGSVGTPTARESPSPPTVIPGLSPGDGRQKTVFERAQLCHTAAPIRPPAVDAGARRIVALLVTYTWRAEGEVFPVREGRNYVGSDSACDVALRHDPQMSGRHATIIYRGSHFWIDDEKSMNGTFVDDSGVEEKQRLRNYSKIKTGGTVWTFLTVEREAQEDGEGS